MMRVKTYLAPSAVEGIGVFAAEPIPKGTITWAFDPPVDKALSPLEVTILPLFMKDHIARYAYLDDRLDLYVLCGDGAKYMNHSEAPNVIGEWTEEAPFGVDLAARDIAAGEEILCDYRSFDKEMAEKMGLERRSLA